MQWCKCTEVNAAKYDSTCNLFLAGRREGVILYEEEKGLCMLLLLLL